MGVVKTTQVSETVLTICQSYHELPNIVSNIGCKSCARTEGFSLKV